MHPSLLSLPRRGLASPKNMMQMHAEALSSSSNPKTVCMQLPIIYHGLHPLTEEHDADARGGPRDVRLPLVVLFVHPIGDAVVHQDLRQQDPISGGGGRRGVGVIGSGRVRD